MACRFSLLEGAGVAQGLIERKSCMAGKTKTLNKRKGLRSVVTISNSAQGQSDEEEKMYTDDDYLLETGFMQSQLSQDAGSDLPVHREELANAIEQARQLARNGLSDRTRELLNTLLEIDPVERAEILAEAYEEEAKIHSHLAQTWRAVRLSDPLTKHIIGYAEREDELAKKARAVATIQRFYAAGYRRMHAREA